jgi:predicted site-specific integrase-resolvase
MSGHNSPDLSLGDIARLLNVKHWVIRRLFTDGKLPEPTRRVGRWRIFTSEDIPAIEEALRKAGHLPSPQAKGARQ